MRNWSGIRDGEPDPLRRRQQAAQAPTVNDGLDRFFSEFCPERVRIGRMSPNTVAEYRVVRRRRLTPRNRSGLTRYHADRRPICAPNNTPGLIDTDMTSSKSDELRAHIIASTPAGRTGTPDDIAKLTHFLLSDAAGFVTGQTYIASGDLATLP